MKRKRDAVRNRESKDLVMIDEESPEEFAASEQEVMIPEQVGLEEEENLSFFLQEGPIVDVLLDEEDEDEEGSEREGDDEGRNLPMKRGTLLQGEEDGVIQRDLLKKYYQEVKRYPLLSKEQEYELALDFSKTKDGSIAFRLVTANLRLVIKIAMEYQSVLANVMDLIQEGNVGLLKAVSKYDPHKGVRLATYAQWWIRAYILKYLVQNARMVKVGTTQAQRKLFFSLNKEKNRLKAAGFKPDASMLAKNLDVDVKDIKEMEQRMSRPDLSMDLPIGDGQKSTVGDLMASEDLGAEERLVGNDLKTRVRFHLDAFAKTLKDREHILWEKRLMAEERLTLREVGDLFGLTRERARQIEKGVLLRLRDYLQRNIPELEEDDLLPTIGAADTKSSEAQSFS